MSCVNFRRALRSALLGLAAAIALSSAASAGDTFVYVHNRGSATAEVFAFKMDADGTMTPVSGSPFDGPDGVGTCGGYCMTAAEGKLGKDHFLFTGGPAGVTSWAINVNGTLDPVAGSPYDAGLGVQNFVGTAAFSKGGRLFVYSSVAGTGDIAGFEVKTGGVLDNVPGSPFDVAATPVGLDAAAGIVVCASQTGMLSSFKAQGDGSLVAAPGSPIPVPSIYEVQLDDKGKTAYLSNGASILGFRVNKKTAELAPVASNPADDALGNSLGGEEVLQPRLVLSVALGITPGLPDVVVFTRASDGSLTLLGRHVTGLGSITAHAADRKGKRLVVISNDATNPNLASYRLDATTGAMILADQEQITVASVNDIVVAEF